MAVTSAFATINFAVVDPATFGLSPSVNIGVNQSITINFANGSGANAFGLFYSGTRTFSGSTDVLNLTSGLTDPDGTAIVAARIKGVWIYNSGADNVVVGAGTNPISTLLNAAGTITLPPGAIFGVATPDATGWVVTASTAMNLTMTGTSGQTYEIILFVSNT